MPSMDPFVFLQISRERLAIPDKALPAVTGRALSEEEEERVPLHVQSLLSLLTHQHLEKIKNRLIKVMKATPSEYVLWKLVNTIVKTAVADDDAYILFARLCSGLKDKLPRISSEKPGLRVVDTFERLLEDKCLSEFDSLVRQSQRMDYDEKLIKIQLLRTLRLVAELYKQKKTVPAYICHYIIQRLLSSERTPEMYIVATCRLLSSIGKQLEPIPPQILRLYFEKLDDLAAKLQLTPPLRVMVLEQFYFEKLDDLTAKLQLTPPLRVMVLELFALRVNDWGTTPASTHSQQEGTDFATASTGNGTSN